MGKKANWHKAKHGLITKAKNIFWSTKQEGENSKNVWGEKRREEKRKREKKKEKEEKKKRIEEERKSKKVWNYEFLYEFP